MHGATLSNCREPFLLHNVAKRAEPEPVRPGEGRYVVQSEIASGGMGAVYRVLDRVSGETQALKRVMQRGSKRRYAIEAFEREYHVLASLDHPRIIRVFDYGVDADGPYYTMELLEGQDLRRAAPLVYRSACSYLRDIATSLALLHGRRLLHRDLSPSNVRVTPDGHCKLFDFGALTAFGPSGHVVGTPPLIAPEAISGAPLDQRTDLYSLGALAYWLLTGRHAFAVRKLSELNDAWSIPPQPPSAYATDVPPELDALVLSLLNRDPLARPSSAAEVIARLDVIGELEPENSAQTARLAQSFFASPRFTGRTGLLDELNGLIESTLRGKGAAVRIDAVPGMGRTRLLEEVALRARLAGLTVLSADAGMSRKLQGTAQTLVQRAFDLLPDLARDLSRGFQAALSAVGQRVEPSPSPADSGRHSVTETSRPLAEFFAELSGQRPLLIEIDNIENADDASQGLLASLASLAERFPVLLVVTEARKLEQSEGIGSIALRRHSRTVALDGLPHSEMVELMRSIFADAPNVERFAEWLHERAAGSPLHAIEICRRLLATGVIRYASGLWTLPAERPSAELSSELSDALAIRLSSLSDAARTLAECLSLQRQQPTLGLCSLLCASAEKPEQYARGLLDELVRSQVLVADRGAYRFTSSALCTALARHLDEERLETNHRRLGEAFAELAGEDLALRIEAGFHLIQGGDEVRGADLIASATHNSSRFRQLLANLYHVGQPIATALKVYRKHRRTRYERLPLLSALSTAGYFENRTFGEEYGDEALDVLEDVTGLRHARRLRRYVGSALGMMLGLMFAFVRYKLTPKRERPFSFKEILTQLFSAVTALTGTAALSLDAVRASKVADVLEPFAFLPERTTPVGVYQFCKGLSEIPRENAVAAYETFQELLRRFSNRRYYPTLPDEARELYLAAVHFARAAFALFRADGSATLESADALDATGLKLYAMIASQLRSLYYAARGEFDKAAPHRDQVELHAAHMGSVWQVETWEAAALILIHAVAIGEVVSATRIVHQLEAISRNVPSLKHYSRLAQVALIAAQRDKRYLHDVRAKYAAVAPRSYIGWAATVGSVVRSYNQIGEFAEAKALSERAMAHVTDADRELVALFLPLDIHLAYADAGLGDVPAALTRLNGLIARFAKCDHPLLQGMLHEARAYICWEAKRFAEYSESVRAAEHWYRSTGTPALIAKCERLIALSNTTKSEVAPIGYGGNTEACETAILRPGMESLPPTDHITL
ncbi:MAG TPA: protein kinase [Polyangiales bacterium]|nr:protein kinase [Polyangiales bacterium]